MKTHTITLLLFGLLWSSVAFAQCNFKLFHPPVNLACGNGSVTFASTPVSTGGISSYEFIWRFPQGNIISTDSMVTVTAIGDYTVEATNSEGCTVLDTITVVDNSEPYFIIDEDGFGFGATDTYLNCQLVKNFTAYASVSDCDLTPFNFNPSDLDISTTPLTPDASGNIVINYILPRDNYVYFEAGGLLSTGTYLFTYTYKDISVSEEITLGTSLSMPSDCAISIVDSPCGVSPTLLSVDCGNNTPQSYLWDLDGALFSTEQEISATIGGVYCVQVINDNNNCTFSDCVTLSNLPSPMEVLIIATQQPRCNTDNSGALTAVVSGGTPPYTYTWSNGFAGSAPTGLPPGTYSLTVTDANDCETIASIDLMATLQVDAGADQVVYCEGSVEINSQAFSNTTIGFSSAIFGDAEFSNSQQEVIPFEGINGYIGENIPSPNFPQNLDDLHVYVGSATASQGDNICIPVTVDNFNDVVGMAFTLSYDPEYLQFNSIINLNPDLPGFNVNANFGVPPALPDGFITVSYFSSSINISTNLPGDAVLFRICFTVIAENSDITYEWTGPNNFMDDSPITTVIKSGIYTLRVTDNNIANCWAEDEVEVTFIDTISINLVEDQTLYCEQSLEVGLADASTAISLSDNGPIPVEVLNMTFLNVGAELTNGYVGTNLPSNSSSSDNMPLPIFAASQGGIPGEIIEIDITLGEFDDLLSFQLPLEYDINLLEFVGVVSVNNATFPTLSSGLNTPDQANGIDGFIGISWFDPSFSGVDVSDNTPLITLSFMLLAQPPQSYTYGWTGPNNFTDDSPVVTLTESGIYTVVLSDSDFPNCWAEDEVEISFIDSLNVDIGESTILYCEDVPYTINSEVSGGEGTYDYLWSTGENTPSITITPAPGETYYLTVTDAGDCVGIDSVLMEPAPPILIQPIADLFVCEGDFLSIFPTVEGGIPPYSYEWSTGDTGTGILINVSGTYALTVTDQNGCTATEAFTAIVSASPIITMPAQYNICPGESVTLEPFVSGGTPGFTFLWSNGANTPTITVAPFVTSSYSVTVVNADGCIASIETQVLVNSLAAFPSIPFCDDNGTPSDPNDDAYFVEAYFTGGSASGWIATSSAGTQSGAYGVPAIFGPFPVLAGDVEIQVVDADNPSCSLILPVSSPDCLPDCDIQVQILNETCDFGGTPSDPSDDTFTIDVIVTGTNTSTSWLASNGQAGAYDVVTTFGSFTLATTPIELIFFDSNDSECTATIELNPNCTPQFCAINTSFSTISCDDNDTPSDGTDDLYTITFFASSVGSSDSFQLSLVDEVYIGAYLEPLVITTSLVEGNSYDVNVVDNEDPTCTDLISFTAPNCIDPCEDTDIIITITSIDVSCNGGADACIEITAEGGTPPYTYNWMFGDTSPFICGLTSGTYSVTVTDANGCNEVQEISIDEPPLLQGFITEVQAPTCETSFDGVLQIDIVGGTQPYAYIWSNGATPPQITGLGPGTYTITVVDANGCEWVGQHTLLPSIIAEAGSSIAISCLNASVVLDGSGSSAGPDIEYEWTYPDGTISNSIIITVNEPGVYELQVTNTSVPDCHSYDQVTVATDIVNLEVGYNLISCDSANLFYTPFLPNIEGDWTFPDGNTAPVSTFTGTTQTGMHYLDIVDANSGCAYADSIFVDLDPSTCVSLKGRLVRDTLMDCIPSIDEPGLCNWLIVIEGEGNIFYAVTQANGDYEQDVPAGTYEVYPLIPSSLWIACEDIYAVVLDTPGDMAMLDIPIQEQQPCPDLSVDFSLPLLRRCWTRSLYVHYCNNGTAIAEDAYIEVTLDDAFSYQSATAPLIAQDGQTFTFDIGDVAINQCSNFKITFIVSCDAIVGESLCTEAKIFPNAPCETIDPLWSGASLNVSSICEEDQVTFRVENTGTGDMSLPSACIVIEDGLMLFVIPDSLRLDAGDFYDYEFPANGSTYRLEIEQVPFHPGFSQPVAVLEGCGEDDFGNFSTGFVNQLPLDDTDDFIDIECREVVGSYDPNDKHGFPRGYGDENYIYPGTELEYLVNFQNTGNDTAFLVVIRDTLSEHLDITSVRPGGASHLYTWDIDGDNVLVFTFDNILLPDSTTNLEGSQGFIEYKVAQRADLPLGTVIENSAAIYFDINEPIITNTTSHQLGKDFIEIINLTIDPQLSDASVEVMPNPTREEAIFNLYGWPENEKRFELMNSKGQIVAQQVFNGSSFIFHRDFLPSGLYFFRLWDESGHWAAGTVIMQ